IGATTDWSLALADISVVIHSAARVHVMHDTASEPLAKFREVNVDGTLTLARQAADAGVCALFLSVPSRSMVKAHCVATRIRLLTHQLRKTRMASPKWKPSRGFA